MLNMQRLFLFFVKTILHNIYFNSLPWVIILNKNSPSGTVFCLILIFLFLLFENPEFVSDEVPN